MKHPVPDRVKQSFVVFDIRHTGLTRSGSTGCFITLPIWQQWTSKVKEIELTKLTSIIVADVLS